MEFLLEHYNFAYELTSSKAIFDATFNKIRRVYSSVVVKPDYAQFKGVPLTPECCQCFKPNLTSFAIVDNIALCYACFNQFSFGTCTKCKKNPILFRDTNWEPVDWCTSCRYSSRRAKKAKNTEKTPRAIKPKREATFTLIRPGEKSTQIYIPASLVRHLPDGKQEFAFERGWQ